MCNYWTFAKQEIWQQKRRNDNFQRVDASKIQNKGDNPTYRLKLWNKLTVKQPFQKKDRISTKLKTIYI